MSDGAVRITMDRNLKAVLVWRQFRGSALLAARRLARSKFLVVCLILALLPTAIAAIYVYGNFGRPSYDINKIHSIYEGLIRILYLHFIVFFSANILGFAAVRQEMDDKTLHYLLLQPVPRPILILGKAAACLSLGCVLCFASLWVTYLTMTLPLCGGAAVVADLFGEGRFVVLLKESCVLALGLSAYAGIAMLMGSIFKSALFGLFLLGWEAGLPYLPSVLKKWTVMHYLQSLLPERLTEQRQLFELLGEPSSVLPSIAIVLGVSATFIAACAVVFQYRECLYKDAQGG